MHSEMRAQLAFRLTGLRSNGRLPADARNLRPALASRLRDLEALRYDFPVVLPGRGDEVAIPLTRIVDGVLEKVAPADAEGERIRSCVLRLEREMRRLLNGSTRSLASLWDAAAQRISCGDAPGAADLAVARKALDVDGEVIDCNPGFSGQLVLRAWNIVQRRKAERFHAEVQRLIARLAEILVADEARSPQARSAERLREGFGDVHRESFDFEAMSALLGRAAGRRPLAESRRRRIRSLLVALESQRFFLDESGFTFTFERAGVALRTFRARYARLRSLARCLAMARLEVEGRYHEAHHDALFQQLRQSPLARDELARFPDYLVHLRESDLDGQGRAECLELLGSGVPAKVLLQVDDLLEESAFGDGLAAIGARAQALVGAALGLGDVFVLQACASGLPRLGGRLLAALEHPGPALIAVFSGAPGDTCCLPPYLNAAAAAESRAFPAFSYDPRRPLDGGSRFALEGNPQDDRDWPVHAFEYEDGNYQRVATQLAFTVADFAAADERMARHFMTEADGACVPLADWIDAADGESDAAPVIAMVDRDDRLLDVLTDDTIVDLARRTRDQWRRLRSLVIPARAGIQAPAIPADAQVPAPAIPAEAGVQPPVIPAEAGIQPKPAPDEACIETPRCTTCNECTQLNNRMFAYDANKQAYIADINAGTYRELVEAAESCQVSIIHPGRPRNPDEPGIEELLERAKPFL